MRVWGCDGVPHLEVLLEVRQLLEGSDEASLILKIDTKPLVHWIEPVAKLHTHTQDTIHDF